MSTKDNEGRVIVWVTEIRTADGKSWAGPQVPGTTKKAAKKYCQNNGLGYCKVIGMLIQ